MIRQPLRCIPGNKYILETILPTCPPAMEALDRHGKRFAMCGVQGEWQGGALMMEQSDTRRYCSSPKLSFTSGTVRSSKTGARSSEWAIDSPRSPALVMCDPIPQTEASGPYELSLLFARVPLPRSGYSSLCIEERILPLYGSYLFCNISDVRRPLPPRSRLSRPPSTIRPPSEYRPYAMVALGTVLFAHDREASECSAEPISCIPHRLAPEPLRWYPSTAP